jgi:hypothetical protein
LTGYRVRGLPDGSLADQEFEFMIDDIEPPLRLRIPGEQRGPDVCIADSVAQERWLDNRPDLVIRVWDCEWRFVNEEATDRFVLMLRNRGAVSPTSQD